jgi:hypothetical protein
MVLPPQAIHAIAPSATSHLEVIRGATDIDFLTAACFCNTCTRATWRFLLRLGDAHGSAMIRVSCFGREIPGRRANLGWGIVACMFLAVRYLRERLSGPRARAVELLALRRRLLAQAGPGNASPAEEQLATRLRELRVELAAQLGRVDACAHCMPPPSAEWPGGQCCSAETRELWSDDELAALRLAGTTPSHLKPPRGRHFGCAFRGSSGCSLEVAHRPSVCVGYACRGLLVEIRRREDEPAIARLQDELGATFQRFVAERTARIEANLFEELKSGLLEREPEQRIRRG